MRIRRWIEAVNLGITKRQFSHQLVIKLMDAINRVHRAHSWSWAQQEFAFTTQSRFQSGTFWSYTQGESSIFALFGADIGPEWTGAELYATNDLGTIHRRIVRVGDRDDQTYSEQRIWLDQPIELASHAFVVTLFRREYALKTTDGIVADSLSGDLRRRNQDSTRNALTHLNQIEFYRDFPQSGDFPTAAGGDPAYYTTGPNETIPAPRFGPEVTGNGVLGAKTPPVAGGTVYMAFAFEDAKSGVRGPVGPIVKYELPPASAVGFNLDVEYGNETGVPEESYKLWLLVSPYNPTGFDGIEPTDKDFRVNEGLIPLSAHSEHLRLAAPAAGTKGGGVMYVNMDEGLFLYSKRWWIWNEQMIVRFREAPIADWDYICWGKVRHPWMNHVDDEPLVPDEHQDIVQLAVRSGIQGEAGLLSERRFQFTLRELRRKDSRKSISTTPRPERYGRRVPYFDRYDLG